MSLTSVLGVKINDVSLSQAVDIVSRWLDQKERLRKYYIVTPNPEFLVLASSDREFRNILNRADLAVPDGVGLKLSGKIKNQTPGVDLMIELCRLSARRGFTVGFLGGSDGVAVRTSERLKRMFPKLRIGLAEDGPVVDVGGNQLTSHSLQSVTDSRQPAADILFIGFGMGKQERWIAQNIGKLSVKVMMGVGGSFDYISGLVPRAPVWMRGLGLEWLFRLMIQPWRIKRQLALVKYLWLILKRS